MLRMSTGSGRVVIIWMAVLLCSTLSGDIKRAEAQTMRELFKKVAPSVVVIRARGRDVTAGGETHFAETGSGVLISADGKVMTDVFHIGAPQGEFDITYVLNKK